MAGQIFNFNLDLGLRKTFTLTLNYLLLWAHPESVMWGKFPPTSYPKFPLRGGKKYILNLGHLCIIVYPESLSQVRHGWVFFLADLGEFPPFSEKMRFCLGVWKKYIVNLDRLLIWTLSKIWHFYLFVDMGGTHLFCQKCEILLGDWKKFQPQPWLFIGQSFSWEFEQNQEW